MECLRFSGGQVRRSGRFSSTLLPLFCHCLYFDFFAFHHFCFVVKYEHRCFLGIAKRRGRDRTGISRCDGVESVVRVSVSEIARCCFSGGSLVRAKSGWDVRV